MKTYLFQKNTELPQIEVLKKFGYTAIQFYSSDYSNLDTENLTKVVPYRFNSLAKISNVIFFYQVQSDLDFLNKNLLNDEINFIEIIISKNISEKLLFEFLVRHKSKKIYFTFPIHFGQSNQHYSLKEAHLFIKKMQSYNFEIKPRADLPVRNLLIENQLFYENDLKILFEKRNRLIKLFSIVIPVYDNVKTLLFTLKKISQVDFDKKQIEVIISDDGSSENILEALNPFLSSFDFDLIIIKKSRSQQRQMSDFQYRAGLARNIGAAFSNAKYLFFLDCDTLIPENIFKTVLQEISEDDLVICKRQQLKAEFSASLENLNKLNTFVSDYDDQYWKHFYQQADIFDPKTRDQNLKKISASEILYFKNRLKFFTLIRF